jgi:hypothetical protein
VLKVSGRALLGSGTIRFVIDAARAALWRRFMRMLNQRYPGPRLARTPDPARASVGRSLGRGTGDVPLSSVELG